jgi:hypothetical protein
LTPRTFNNRAITTSAYLEAAKSWLALVPRETPFICRWTKRQIQELKRDFTKATRIKFLENGFRNSWATYALNLNGEAGVGKLAIEMGNSEAIAKRYYVRNLRPGAGKSWFGLRPPATAEPAKIVAFNSAA